MPFSIHYLILAIYGSLLTFPVRARCYPLLLQKSNPKLIIKSIGCQTALAFGPVFSANTASVSVHHGGKKYRFTTEAQKTEKWYPPSSHRSLRHPGRFQSGTTIHCPLSTVHCPYCIWACIFSEHSFRIRSTRREKVQVHHRGTEDREVVSSVSSPFTTSSRTVSIRHHYSLSTVHCSLSTALIAFGPVFSATPPVHCSYGCQRTEVRGQRSGILRPPSPHRPLSTALIAFGLNLQWNRVSAQGSRVFKQRRVYPGQSEERLADS